MSISRPPLEEMTLRDLRKVASKLAVSRYSRMRKVELINAIQAAQGRRTPPAPAVTSTVEGQTKVEATKFEPVTEPVPMAEPATAEDLATVDDGLPDLPSGYGESRIMLMPRDPQWAYAYWDVPNEHKQALRRQGGTRLALRFYDVTDIDLDRQAPHSLQQYECDELARDWYLPIPVSDRDYVAEIGYVCPDGRWLMLARSAAAQIPPVYPSDWVEDRFMAVDWEQNLQGETLATLTPPQRQFGFSAYGSLMAGAAHVAGSLMGAAHPDAAISSYVFPSGVGLWASGVGFSTAAAASARPFWLVADAELVIYGATEPGTTVTVGGQSIKVNADGTFRFQMSLQDGILDYPIVATAADGEQIHKVHMRFTRDTLQQTGADNEPLAASLA